MNPKKPTKLKLLAGNPGKRTLGKEPDYTPTDTKPPEWLAGDGLSEWQAVAQAMQANGLLNQANKPILAVYCDLLGNYVAARRNGDAPDLKTLQQLRMMAREFGFTPSSQAGISLNPSEPENAKSRFFS